MNQSKILSAIESTTNTVTGYVISVAVGAWIFPMYGFRPTLAQNGAIVFIFAITSFARSYVIRRMFNSIRGNP